MEKKTIENDNKLFTEKYELRQVRPNEAETAAKIEATCFPPSE